MSLTPLATGTGGSTSPKISPNSITTVNYYSRASDVSAWTSSAPQVLYTAPSDCKYVRIVIPDTGKNANTTYNSEAFKLESSGSHHHWYALGIVNDTNNTEDMILKNYSGNTSYELFLNSFSQGTVSNQYNYVQAFNRSPFDVIATWRNNSGYQNLVTISQDRFVLNPGEKFVAITGNNSTNAYIYANFQAWVYN